jgi:adenosine deaminase
MLGRVQSPAAHPIRKLVDAGVIVTVSTDDVSVFGQGVSEEFLRLFSSTPTNWRGFARLD